MTCPWSKAPSSVLSLGFLDWPASSSVPVLLAHVHSRPGPLMHCSEVVMGRPLRYLLKWPEYTGETRPCTPALSLTWCVPQGLTEGKGRRGEKYSCWKTRSTNFGKLEFARRHDWVTQVSAQRCLQQPSHWGSSVSVGLTMRGAHVLPTRCPEPPLLLMLFMLSGFSRRLKNPLQWFIERRGSGTLHSRLKRSKL